MPQAQMRRQGSAFPRENSLEKPQGGGLSRLASGIEQMPLAVQFLVAASVVIFVLMAALSYWIAERIESAALKGAGAAGALHLQTFVAPLIERLPNGDFRVGPALQAKFDEMMSDRPMGHHVREIKIWRPDGSLLYAASGQAIAEPSVFEELEGALKGEIEVSRTYVDKHEYRASEREAVYIEVYAPLLRDDSGKVVLVGEFYEQPDYIEDEIVTAKRATVLVVAGVSIPMIGLLYLIVRGGSRLIERQRRALTASLHNAIDLSVENNRLRLSADNARIEAGKLNEKILDQIGSDLHDGPLQLLTLVKLRMSDLAQSVSAGKAKPESLIKLMDILTSVLEELRNIASGLVLPELEYCDLDQTVRLAIKRFSEITGVEVSLRQRGVVPVGAVADLNICVYRFVLEGLMNSFRHAPGSVQAVSMTVSGARLYISVADSGGMQPQPSAREVERVRLGKTSQKRRVRSFGGRMRYFRRPTGTIASACLPLSIG